MVWSCGAEGGYRLGEKVYGNAGGGNRSRGRPRKTWLEVVRGDMKVMGLTRGDAQDRHRWRSGILGKPANLGKPRKRP